MDPFSAHLVASFRGADLAAEAARSRLAEATRHHRVVMPIERARVLETIPRQRVPAAMSGSHLE